ncbi:MAG: hypothetical protein EXR72_11985 [Myxococcales bacterium]|nr:hypothetical protein [Myxococcales bacterium]
MSSYRILSLDGGAGAITYINCLVDLERRSPGFVAATDLFVGSSAGSFLAIYLACNVALVDAGRISGVELLEACRSFLTAAARAMVPASPQAYVDMVLGKGPLSNYDKTQALMQEEANYGPTTTLGDLPPGRRVVVPAGRAGAPWGPRTYDSADPADAGERLYDVALRSGSFPIVFPIRDGQVDGAVNTNNPAMIGLVRALAGRGKVAAVPHEEIVLINLGADDGSSNLSNLFMPEQPEPPRDLPAPPGPPVLPEVEDALKALGPVQRAAGERLRLLLTELHDGDRSLLNPTIRAGLDGTIGALGVGLELAVRQLRGGPPPALLPSPPPSTPASSEWGWLPWFAFPMNLLYLLQVMLNSEGRGVAQQCHELLGDRAFRLAPVGLVPSNVGFLIDLLGMVDLLVGLGALTAKQWAVEEPEWVRALYNFQPCAAESHAWIAERWMKG